MKNADMPAMATYSDRGKLLNLKEGYPDYADMLDEGTNFAMGTTKREHFAAMAMQGLLANQYYIEHGAVKSDISAMARDHANDLLAALEKS